MVDTQWPVSKHEQRQRGGVTVTTFNELPECISEVHDKYKALTQVPPPMHCRSHSCTAAPCFRTDQCASVTEVSARLSVVLTYGTNSTALFTA